MLTSFHFKVDAEGRSETRLNKPGYSATGLSVWISFARDRRLERTPVEDVRQATTGRALGSADHVFTNNTKMPRSAQSNRSQPAKTRQKD
jgi:hypothetical protein